jgi:hypothetical protein
MTPRLARAVVRPGCRNSFGRAGCTYSPCAYGLSPSNSRRLGLAWKL